MTEYAEVLSSVRKLSKDAVLVSVSKTHPYERVTEAYSEGARIFGENRVQEAERKFPAKGERPDGMLLYLIGHLQKNKVRKAVRIFDRIESVDSIELIDLIEKEAEGRIEILLEFNSSGDENKTGFASESDLIEAAEYCSGKGKIILRGIMTIGPLGADPSDAFRRTENLLDKIKPFIEGKPVLSMGMSGDWEKAIGFGSNEVRIGTKIFGERQ